jgi:hypothetical protein
MQVVLILMGMYKLPMMWNLKKRGISPISPLSMTLNYTQFNNMKITNEDP